MVSATSRWYFYLTLPGVDTLERLTVQRHDEKYALSTQVVTNWISRGTIRADCTIELPELSNIRLVFNQLYKQ